MKKFFLGLVITLIFISLLLTQIDLEEVKVNLTNINYAYIVIAVLVHMIGFVLRAYRWKYLVESLDDSRKNIRTFFNISSVGYMLNNLLPLRLGDVTKSLILARELSISRSMVFGTVIVEKISDGLSLVVILGLSFIFIPIPDQIKNTFFILSVLFILPVVVLFGVSKFRDIVKKTLNNLPHLAKIMPIIKNFWQGLGTKNSLGKNFNILLLSLVIWLVEGVMVYFVAQSMGIDFDVFVSIFVTALTNLGVIIPSAPGYVGPFEFFMTIAAGVFGLSASLGVSLAIVTHLAQWLPITLIGIIIVLSNQDMLNLIRKKENKI